VSEKEVNSSVRVFYVEPDEVNPTWKRNSKRRHSIAQNVPD